MFTSKYFASRYYADRYFPAESSVSTVIPLCPPKAFANDDVEELTDSDKVVAFQAEDVEVIALCD